MVPQTIAFPYLTGPEQALSVINFRLWPSSFVYVYEHLHLKTEVS